MELLKKFGQSLISVLMLVMIIACFAVFFLSGQEAKPEDLLTSIISENWLASGIIFLILLGSVFFWMVKEHTKTRIKHHSTRMDASKQYERELEKAKPDYTFILDQYTCELNIIGAPETLMVLSLKNLVSMAFTVSDRDDKKAGSDPKDQEDSHNKTINDIFNKLITSDAQNTTGETSIKPLVISGDPGSGKTSLIKYLCQYFIKNPDNKETLHLKTDKKFLPLYLPLSAWNEKLDDIKDESPYPFPITDLARRLSRFYSVDKSITLNPVVFQKWLDDEEENILLLLDGLDEVQLIEEACKDINHYWSTLKKKPLLIITSRILAYEQYRDKLPKHWQARVQPIVSIDEQKLFVKEVFSALSGEKVGSTIIEQQTDQFGEQLEGDNNKSLVELCQWPFLLQAMAVLWLDNKERDLPQNRAALYFALIKLLLLDHDLIKDQLFTAVVRKWFPGMLMPQLKMSPMDHLHILGSVALTMIQQKMNNSIKITTLQATLVDILEKEKPNFSKKQLEQSAKDYRIYLTKRAQLLKQPSKQSVNLMFAHKSLLDYSAAWKMRHQPSDIAQFDSQTQGMPIEALQNLDVKSLLNTLFGDYADEDFKGHDSQAQQQHPWYEVFQFYTQVPDEQLSDDKDVDDHPERLESLSSSTKVWTDLLQTALSEDHWLTFSRNKHFELYFYDLFTNSPNLNDEIFRGHEDNEQDLMRVENLVKDNDPEKMYVLLYAFQSMCLNQFSAAKSIENLQKTITEVLSQWLDSQADQLPDFSQSPENERKAFVYRLALHKAESLIREFRPELLPDWAKNTEMHQIPSTDLFTEKVKRFINTDELNAEYIYIPEGKFPAYSDGGPYLSEGLAAHERSEPYYLARYPVTFRQYRHFIDYLDMENHGLHQCLSPGDFSTRLLEFAGYCDTNHDKSEFVEHLQKKDRYADCLRSTNDTSQGFNNDDQPVCGVNWYDASSYCFWLSCLHIAKQKGSESILNEPLEILLTLFRLPHETEWYWASARHTDEKKSGMKEYCWTDRVLINDQLDEAKRYQQIANYNENIDKTTSVGLYPLGGSTDGLMDMSGNLWEWQSNWVNYGPALRGGSWNNPAEYLPCSVRNYFNPWYRNLGRGFRVSFSRSKFEKIDMPKK